MTSVGLNEAQQHAVQYTGGPLLVVAGAGSGKTRVLTARLVHLIDSCGIEPWQILAVTFTNRAAAEMRRRVGKLLGREPAGLWIGTFHSIAARLLRREAPLIGFAPQFTIYDETDSVSLIKRMLEEKGYSAKEFPPRGIRSIISHAKNRLISPEAFLAEAQTPIERAAGDVYSILGERLKGVNAMDFDDLLLHPLKVFTEHPDRLRHYQERFRAVLVDEFQDTNRAQYLFVKQISALHRELCAVGDDDQSIYGWRGADLRNMLDFQRDHPDTSLVRLEENYRSTRMILDAANGVIAANQERLGKTLFTSRQSGDPVVVICSADERDEAEWIAREIRSQVATGLYGHGDHAVLYRTNAQSRALEDAFRRASIPYRVVGTVSFYARREIRDLVAYLRLIANASDDEAFLRAIQVPRRGLGDSSLRSLREAALAWNKPLLHVAAVADRIMDLRPQAKKALLHFSDLIMRMGANANEVSPATILENVIEEVDYEGHLLAEGVTGRDRLDNVRELISSAAESSEMDSPEEGLTPLDYFLSSAALTTSEENTSGDAEGVTLMTVHTAKGLEWPVVMVAGLEEGLFPLSRSLDSEFGVEEERRLAYVAVTRAQDRLYLTWAKQRRRNGQLVPGIASQFLRVLPPDVVEERRTASGFGASVFRKPVTSPSSYHIGIDEAGSHIHESEPELESQDTPRYIKGERVRHRHFGSGAIRGLSGAGRDLKVIVEFDDEEVGTKNLIVRFAGLERDVEAV
jgi:DNA helicase-2/ATP-dependent DNA helicase PcrA